MLKLPLAHALEWVHLCTLDTCLLYPYFSKKIGFGISFKLTALKTICMKCQSLFSGKKNQRNINLSSVELSQRMVKVHFSLLNFKSHVLPDSILKYFSSENMVELIFHYIDMFLNSFLMQPHNSRSSEYSEDFFLIFFFFFFFFLP